MKWYEAGHSPKKGDKFVFIGADEPEVDLCTGDVLVYEEEAKHDLVLTHATGLMNFDADEIEPYKPDSNADATYILEEENTWK